LESASAEVRHYDARQRLMGIRRQFEAQVSNLAGAMRAQLLETRAALERRTAALEALSPLAILNRGYALIFDVKGELIKDASQLAVGDELSAQLARGRVRARVSGTEPVDS
jgi:exodeoxyribonuclease VII large subunit